jgi:hypothetical protein
MAILVSLVADRGQKAVIGYRGDINMEIIGWTLKPEKRQ